MNLPALFSEIATLYRKHGWQLRSVLLRPESSAQFDHDFNSLKEIPVVETSIDAIWFSRPSHEGREAWELRLLSENAYALFETFEQDETEEQRDEMRQEMENRLRDYATKES